MKGIFRSLAVILPCLLIMLMLLSTTASGDREPNNTLQESEKISMGTHLGSLNYTDYIDWYRIENIDDRNMTVIASLRNPTAEHYIMVTTCDQFGRSDGQVQIFLDVYERTDTCHWQDQGDSGTMYIMVDGTGDYTLYIGYSSDGGGWDPLILIIITLCGILGIIGLIALAVLLIIYLRSR